MDDEEVFAMLQLLIIAYSYRPDSAVDNDDEECQTGHMIGSSSVPSGRFVWRNRQQVIEPASGLPPVVEEEEVEDGDSTESAE